MSRCTASDIVTFRQALQGAIDEVIEKDLVFATAFHEWCAVEADEEGTGWIRGLIEYAQNRGVEIMSYSDYWLRATGGQAADRNNDPAGVPSDQASRPR